uniref:Transmembrane protein 230 n=1 Tax=Ascaris suum TaxID=6253 RepID=F1LFZ9_ASCSU
MLLMMTPLKASFNSRSRDVDNGFSEIQYNLPASKIPWRAVMLAGVLFVMGFALIMSSLLMLTEVVKPSHPDRVWPIFALGLIMFVPGANHVRIAYHAHFEAIEASLSMTFQISINVTSISFFLRPFCGI